MYNCLKVFSFVLIVAILVPGFLSVSIVTALEANGKTRIMPLGDSITVGYPDVEGYRKNLYQDLSGLGFKVDFVGSQKNGTGLDIDNEGHLSYEADEIRDSIYGWLNQNPADILLLHIGTNDIQGQDANSTVAEVSSILDNIDRWESNNSIPVTVILARIILRSDREDWNKTTKEYNIALGTMATARIANGDRLLVVDMQNALNYATDLSDGVHPTSIGYRKIAEVWRNEIIRLLGFTLTINSNQHGLITKSPNQTSYSPGSIVNIYAQPESGWAFNGWSGDLNSSENPINITMNRNMQFTANFTQIQYKLTLLTTSGTTMPAVGEYWYPAGTQIAINVSSPLSGQYERYTWLGWSGSGLGSYTGPINQTVITMNGPITQTANLKHEYRLSISNNLGGITPLGEQWHEAGVVVNLAAEPPTASTGTQYTCTGWSGTGSVPISGSTSTASFVMSSPSTITWAWKTQYYLTISSSYGSPGGAGWYDSGTTAYASVSPTTINRNGVQYTFSGWSGSASGSSSSIALMMDNAKSVTANWTPLSSSTPTKTPNPTQTITPTPTINPSPTSDITSLASSPLSTSPSASPQTIFGVNSYIVYIIIVIAIALVVILVSIVAFRRRS